MNSVNHRKDEWKTRLAVLDKRQIWLSKDQDDKCVSVTFDSNEDYKMIFSKNTDHLSTTGILEDCDDLVISGINGMCRSNCKDDNDDQ